MSFQRAQAAQRLTAVILAFAAAVTVAGSAVASSWGTLHYIVQTDQLAPAGIVTLGNSTVVAAWAEQVSAGNQVVVRRSTDAGSTWGRRVIVGTDANGDGEPIAMAGRGSSVDIVWDAGTGIAYARSVDSGATFGKPMSIPNCGINPSVGRGPNGLVAVSCWDQTGVSVAVSSDGGKTFAPARHVQDADTGVYTYPKIAAGKGVIYLGFFDGGDPDNAVPPTLYVARSLDKGVTWSARRPVGPAYDDQNEPLSFATAGTHAYLAFNGSYIRTVDRGTTWSGVYPLPGGQAKLYLAAGILRALFVSCAGDQCPIFYAESSDGKSWTVPQKVSNEVADAWTIGVGYTGAKAVVAFGTGGYGGYYWNSRLYVRSGTP